MKISDYKLIYVSCKFGGDQERIIYCQEKIKELIKRDMENNEKNKVYLSPLNGMGWLYFDVDYEWGLNMTLKLLEKCDMMYVLPNWETSKGCLQEIGFCKAKGIPIVYL